MSRLTIAIAGAGLLGRLLAFELLRRGHEVHLFDPADSLCNAPGDAPPRHEASPARAAGWTAAGMLSPTAELECANENVFRLGLRSMARWRQIVDELQRHGLPVHLEHQGSLLLAHRGDEGAARRIVNLLAHKAPDDHAPRALAGHDLRALEPDIQGPAHGWLLPHEGQIHTVQAMQALGTFAAAQGACWHGPAWVQATAPGQVRTAQRTHAFDWVFDVRGLGARPELPVRGVRGEIFWLHAPGVALHRPVRLLHPRWRVYLVPRPGDLVVVGASEIEGEDLSPVSVRSTVELLAAAHSVVPALSEARIVHAEVNLRPALPDNLPLVSHERQAQAGLTRINGLFRHGWLIAPALIEQALQDLPHLGPEPCARQGTHFTTTEAA